MRVWNLANQLGYSDEYPGEYEIYMRNMLSVDMITLSHLLAGVQEKWVK